MAAHSFRTDEERSYFMDNFDECDSDLSEFYGFESDDEFDYTVENSDDDDISESISTEDEHACDASWSRVISNQTIVDFTLENGPNLPQNLDVAVANPLKYFSLFFEDAMYDRIATETMQSSAHERKVKPTHTGCPLMGRRSKRFLDYQCSWV